LSHIQKLGFIDNEKISKLEKKNIHFNSYFEIINSNRELSKELIKFSFDEHSISCIYGNINKEKINSLCKKLIEIQDKSEFTISEQDKEVVREAKENIQKLKNFILEDLVKREKLVYDLVEFRNNNA
jgi:DNA-binding PadR family transcriptional regulator